MGEPRGAGKEICPAVRLAKQGMPSRPTKPQLKSCQSLISRGFLGWQAKDEQVGEGISCQLMSIFHVLTGLTTPLEDELSRARDRRRISFAEPLRMHEDAHD